MNSMLEGLAVLSANLLERELLEIYFWFPLDIDLCYTPYSFNDFALYTFALIKHSSEFDLCAESCESS